MKRMLQHHAAHGWGDDTAQPANVPPPGDNSQSATAGAATPCSEQYSVDTCTFPYGVIQLRYRINPQHRSSICKSLTMRNISTESIYHSLHLP